VKKRIQNGKRSKNVGEAALEGQGSDASTNEPLEKSQVEEPDTPQFDASVVDYVRLATCLIEGRRVSREEIVEMLERTMRQHSIAREKRMDYILRRLEKRPP